MWPISQQQQKSEDRLEATHTRARRHSPQQCPELVQVVLQRRTGENDAASTVHLTHLLRNLSNLVLHLHTTYRHISHLQRHVSMHTEVACSRSNDEQQTRLQYILHTSANQPCGPRPAQRSASGAGWRARAACSCSP